MAAPAAQIGTFRTKRNAWTRLLFQFPRRNPSLYAPRRHAAVRQAGDDAEGPQSFFGAPDAAQHYTRALARAQAR
jgi:hypothetical protein